jgi:hypothetical protein
MLSILEQKQNTIEKLNSELVTIKKLSQKVSNNIEFLKEQLLSLEDDYNSYFIMEKNNIQTIFELNNEIIDILKKELGEKNELQN